METAYRRKEGTENIESGKSAALSTLERFQNEEVKPIVDKTLAKQLDKAGNTRPMKHYKRMPQERPFKQKIRRMSESVLGEIIGW